MELALARYRLRFKHPFGTAHGLRDGTDSVFVRLTRNGLQGYGEATLPPYLPYTQDAVFEEIVRHWMNRNIKFGSELGLSAVLSQLCPPARAAMQMAHIDLIHKERNILIESSDQSNSRPSASCMVTLGHSLLADIPTKLRELPKAPILKVKLGAANDVEVIRAVMAVDERPLFLDANQGWTDVAQALSVIMAVGPERLVGLEQPFGKERWDLHRSLKALSDSPIYGDESIQGLEDLERAGEAFDGVNLKLMKCGGLDVAAQMAKRTRELGLNVMLGSMSESSLGCAAMSSLAGTADLLDLDGPWLIGNDPFKGLSFSEGRLQVQGMTGVGVELAAGSLLEFTPIGA